MTLFLIAQTPGLIRRGFVAFGYVHSYGTVVRWYYQPTQGDIMRKFVVTPGEFGPEFIEVDDSSYVVFVDDDDLPPEYALHSAFADEQSTWISFMEDAPDNTRVMIADVKELWSE